MNRIWVLAILCVASASGVELENLCSSDAFEYNGVLVNAFHRLQQSVTFESMSHYLINDTVKCDYFEFKNRTNFWEVLKIKQRYNRQIAEWYTEDLIDSIAEEYSLKRTILERVAGKPLFDIIRAEKNEKGETPVKCLEHFGRTVKSGHGLFDVLARLFAHNGYPINIYADYKPARSELKAKLAELMRRFKSLTDGDTFAFNEESVDNDSHMVYFYKSVLLPKEFKFSTEAGSVRVGPQTKSMIIWDQILPFNSGNHKDENCVPAKELPLFYKSKGKNDID